MIITKYNAICNLGENITEVFEKALSGDTECFEIKHSARLGCINVPLQEIDNKDFDTRANRLILKVLKPLEIEALDRNKTAVVVAATNSGVEEYETSRNPKHFEIGNSAEFVHRYFRFNNFYTTVSTACSSGIKAFSIAGELLESGISENVLVIGVDSIAKLPVYGFGSLEILSEKQTNPFSKNRCGINIGEGAAAFIVTKSGAGIEVSGIGETTDFFHSTTPDPEGVEAERAIRLALRDLQPEDIDYINLHGTGTKANDLMEAKAIYNIFGDKVPASSTKPLTGHCLGVAASIETALCCRLLDTGGKRVFPHIYDGEYDENIPKIQLADRNTRLKQINTCLTVSFGFGGTNCAMVLKHHLNRR